MNEDDTFNALRKWAYEQLNFEMDVLVNKAILPGIILPGIITHNKYKKEWDKLLKKAGWTVEEWQDELKKRKSLYDDRG